MDEQKKTEKKAPAADSAAKAPEARTASSQAKPYQPGESMTNEAETRFRSERMRAIREEKAEARARASEGR